MFWLFKRKQKVPNADHKVTLDASLDRVYRFNDYLLDSGMLDDMRLRDTSQLPWDKEALLRDFELVLAAMPDGAERQSIAVMALSLADFQEGVGEDIVYTIPELGADEASNSEFFAKWKKLRTFHTRINTERARIKGLSH